MHWLVPVEALVREDGDRVAVGVELSNHARRVAVEVRPRVRPAPVERRQRIIKIEAREALQ